MTTESLAGRLRRPRLGIVTALVLLATGVTGCGLNASATTPQRDLETSAAAGTWQITVTVAGASSTFDALYGFADNGVFVRVDGRNNGPSLGAWKTQGKDSVAISFVVFQFDSAGKRVGTINATAQGTIEGDKISGPFDAAGTDLTGSQLPGFPKHGTFEGIRVKA
jgi:hypothetical protein